MMTPLKEIPKDLIPTVRRCPFNCLDFNIKYCSFVSESNFFHAYLVCTECLAQGPKVIDEHEINLEWVIEKWNGKTKKVKKSR